MTTPQSEPWTTTNGDERTDKYPINDVFCMGCRKRIARVHEYRYIHLEGYDRMAVIDCKQGTATVKCLCGVGRVIRSRGNDDKGEKGELNVWLQEIVEDSSGKLDVDSERASQQNRPVDATK